MLILEPKIVQDKIKKVSGFLCRKMLWCRERAREKCQQSKEIIDKMKVVSTNCSQLLRSYEILPCPKPPKTASGTEVVNGVVPNGSVHRVWWTELGSCGACFAERSQKGQAHRLVRKQTSAFLSELKSSGVVATLLGRSVSLFPSRNIIIMCAHSHPY